MPYDPFAVPSVPVATTTVQPTTTTVTPTGTLAPTNALAPMFGPQNQANRKLAIGQYRDARQTWRDGHPDMAPGMSPQDFTASMGTWRDARPDRQDYWSHGQVGDAFAAPAAGNTGIVPPDMLPPAQVGMVPGVPGSMGTNPGGPVMTPGGGTTGAPLQAHDWRTLLANRNGYRF